jgi:zinc protease
MVARVMTDVGGLGSTEHDALVDKLAASGLSTMKVDIGYTDESIQLDGSPKELETLFQLLHLQFTAPMLDSTALAGWQSLVKYQGADVTMDDQFNQVFARGELRMLPVSTGIAELATMRELMDVYRDRFGNAGDFTFTFVGAITPAEARPFVERYIASLPSTGARERPPVSQARPFLRKMSGSLPVLELPKAQTLLVFDGLFPTEPGAYLRGRQEMSALTLVLQDRLRTRLREQLGGTYSPYIGSETIALPAEHYRVFIGFDAAPERMRELNKELMTIVDSVRTHPVSVAETVRAATVQRRQLETALQDNTYWMARIGTYDRLGIPLDRIPAPFGTHRVTPAELQIAAKHYLPDDVYIHLPERPKDTASYPHAAGSTTP